MIKIQIRWTQKQWRKQNEKIWTIPYQYCKLTYTDDWLIFEDSPECIAQQALMMNEDDIRSLNFDFNYHNYGVFYERIDEEMNAGKEDGENGGSPDRDNAAG